MKMPLPKERKTPESDRHASSESDATSHRGESNYGYPNHQDGIQSGNLTGQQHEEGTSGQQEIEQTLPRNPHARQATSRKKTDA